MWGAAAPPTDPTTSGASALVGLRSATGTRPAIAQASHEVRRSGVADRDQVTRPRPRRSGAPPVQEDVVSNGSRRRLSRGDRRRSERLSRLRAIVTRETAVIELAADKQMCALTDPDARVLALRTVRAKAWELFEAVSWGLARAAEAGFASTVVAGEPTGHLAGARSAGCRAGSDSGVLAAAVGGAGPGRGGLHSQQERRHPTR